MSIESQQSLEQENPEILELLPHMLEDSGYSVNFKGDYENTPIWYMDPDVYLKLLRGPTLREKLYYRWIGITDIIWKIFHPWAEER